MDEILSFKCDTCGEVFTISKKEFDEMGLDKDECIYTCNPSNV